MNDWCTCAKQTIMACICSCIVIVKIKKAHFAVRNFGVFIVTDFLQKTKQKKTSNNKLSL